MEACSLQMILEEYSWVSINLHQIGQKYLVAIEFFCLLAALFVFIFITAARHGLQNLAKNSSAHLLHQITICALLVLVLNVV